MMSFRRVCHLLLSIPLVLSAGEKPAAGASPEAVAGKTEASKRVSPQMKAALDKLAMPGVKIDVEKWCVDVDASVCLREGMLELIACTKDTKEHESIIVVEAKPSHIHLGLLLLGAKPGHPATQRALNEERTMFIPVPPQGGLVDVFLVIKDPNGKEVEHPISDFIVRSDSEDEAREGDKAEKFPTHTFLFTGSILLGQGKENRKYLCDESGNVISIATFGDELLSLPDIYDQSDGSLIWQVNGEKLPARDSKIILRLRPQVEAPDVRPPQVKPSEK